MSSFSSSQVLPVLLEGLITELNFVPYSQRKTWWNTTEQNLPAIMRCQHFYFLSQAAATSNYCVSLCYITTDVQWAGSVKGWMRSPMLMISVHQVIIIIIFSPPTPQKQNHRRASSSVRLYVSTTELNANASMATGSSGPPTFMDYEWCSTV